MLRRILTLAAAATLTAGISVAATWTAQAAQVGFHYSANLAGTVLQGNGSLSVAGTWRQVSLPDESSAFPAVPNDEVAVGILMFQNVGTGGFADGEAFVWSDTHQPGTCGLHEWTLEYNGSLPYNLILNPVNPEPIPVPSFVPLDFFGAPVCMTGGSEFLYMYHSVKYGQVDFSAGPNSHDWDILATDHGQHFLFHSGASGINTTSAPTAELLNGTVLGNSGVGYFISGHGNSVFGQGVNLSHLNYSAWDATAFGGSPSVADPLTLTVNPASVLPPSGPYEIDAP